MVVRFSFHLYFRFAFLFFRWNFAAYGFSVESVPWYFSQLYRVSWEMLKERESLERGGSSPCSLGSTGLEVATCAGCGGRIHDRYYLLAVDRQWHAHCLKCCECKLPLDTELTCFARDGNIYCKEDYYR